MKITCPFPQKRALMALCFRTEFHLEAFESCLKEIYICSNDPGQNKKSRLHDNHKISLNNEAHEETVHIEK